jgi:hypothetical protein
MDFGGGGRRDTAVHESGHAVARVLSIGRVGITNENAIRWIEMDRGTPHCSVFELPLGMPGLKEFGEREGCDFHHIVSLSNRRPWNPLLEVSFFKGGYEMDVQGATDTVKNANPGPRNTGADFSKQVNEFNSAMDRANTGQRAMQAITSNRDALADMVRSSFDDKGNLIDRRNMDTLSAAPEGPRREILQRNEPQDLFTVIPTPQERQQLDHIGNAIVTNPTFQGLAIAGGAALTGPVTVPGTAIVLGAEELTGLGTMALGYAKGGAKEATSAGIAEATKQSMKPGIDVTAGQLVGYASTFYPPIAPYAPMLMSVVGKGLDAAAGVFVDQATKNAVDIVTDIPPKP